MADSEREEILANFQACTGIDDLGLAIYHLDETNWSLMDAVKNAMPQESQTLPSEQDRLESVIPLINTDDVKIERVVLPAPPVPSADVRPLLGPFPSSSMDLSSGSPRRMLDFVIQFRGNQHELRLPDNEVVGTIKTLLENEIRVPKEKMSLEGWKRMVPIVTDWTPLSDLNLPKMTELFVLVPCDFEIPEVSHHTNGEDPEIVERFSRNFKLNIKDSDQDKDYHLNYPGSKTISEVKGGIFSLTDIPVSKQVWTGWPEGVENDGNLTLAASGISFPCHSFTVSKAKSSERLTKKQVEVDLTMSDESEEDFQDAADTFASDDDMFSIDPPNSRRGQPLIPEDIEGETEALESFTQEFESRYGECHPVFFLGSLDDALREACLVPAENRKLLAVYLHHDASVLSNVFCSDRLCSEAVVSFLSAHFITWAWDMTLESNRAKLLTTITRHFGSVAATTVRNFDSDQLPLLLIITRTRATTEVTTILKGDASVDELMSSLIHTVDMFTEQQRADVAEEEERKARELMKREQEEAYEQSLQADRLKEEAKRQEQAEKEAEEQQRLEELSKIEQNRLQEEQLKEAIRKSLAEQLPEQPPEGTGDVRVVRLRTPSSETLQRRFKGSEKLQVLLNWIASNGFPVEEYKVLQSWPRRDVSTLNPEESLTAVKLSSQEMLTIEER